jgi:hypothetical protein
VDIPVSLIFSGAGYSTIAASLARSVIGYSDGMVNEKITVRVTETRQTLDVVVYSKRAEVIEVVLGEGMHSMKCALTPTRNELAYAGTIMGREIVYERSRAQVQADIDRLNPVVKGMRRR